MGWTGEVFVQEGYPDSSADNTVEASIVGLAGGIVVAGGLDNDWYNLTLRAFRADGDGGLEGGPVFSIGGYPDWSGGTNPNGTSGDPDGWSLAFDDLNKFVQISDYTFAYIGEASTDFASPGVIGSGGNYYCVAQFITVNPTDLSMTRTGAAFADWHNIQMDECTGAAWNGKLVVMSGVAGSTTGHYIAICDPVGNTTATTIASPTTHTRMGPIAVSGNKAIYWDDDAPGWYYVNLPGGGGGLLTADDMGMNYSWAWFAKTLQDGRIAVIITGTAGADGSGDPLKLVIFNADLSGAYSGPYTIATTAKNVGWTGGWYSNVRSIDEFPNGDLLIGYLVGNNQPWLARVNPSTGAIISKWQPAHNTNVSNCWNYEIATFGTNNTDFLLMWAGYSDGGWGTYRLLVGASGDSFGSNRVVPLVEDFERGTDGARVTTINTNFPGIDYDEDPYANDAEIYFTTDSHSGTLAAMGYNYSLLYPYTYDPTVLITGDPESGTFWMKIDYSSASSTRPLFTIATGDVGDQQTSANENLTLYHFDGENQLQWEDHTYDTPVLVPSNTWFKVEWSVTGPAYTIKISDGGSTVWLDIAKDMDDDGNSSPYYKFAYVAFNLPVGVVLDDVNTEDSTPPDPPDACSPVGWWDGTAIQRAELFGWNTGSGKGELEALGWWDGNAIQPLDCVTAESVTEPPPPGPGDDFDWHILDLSTADFYMSGPDVQGEYVGGMIQRASNNNAARFGFDETDAMLVANPAYTFEIEMTIVSDNAHGYADMTYLYTMPTGDQAGFDTYEWTYVAELERVGSTNVYTGSFTVSAASGDLGLLFYPQYGWGGYPISQIRYRRTS